MRIYMQSSDYADRVPRYVQLVLQQDLLSGWTLISESGRQTGRGRVKTQHFETYEQAMDALLSLRDKTLERGFRVVFFQGEMAE